MLCRPEGGSLVRVNTGSLPLRASDGSLFNLLQSVRALADYGNAGARSVTVGPKDPVSRVAGRVCAIRKSDAAIAIAEKKLRGNASARGKALKPRNSLLIRFWNGIGFGGGSSWSSSASSPSPSSVACPSTILKAQRHGYMENCSQRYWPQDSSTMRRPFPLGIRTPLFATRRAGIESSSLCSIRCIKRLIQASGLPMCWKTGRQSQQGRLNECHKLNDTGGRTLALETSQNKLTLMGGYGARAIARIMPTASLKRRAA